MRYDRRYLALAIVLALPLAGLSAPAKATFSCTVGETPEGYAALYAEPSTTSAVIRRIEDGDLVSLIDPVETPAPEDWAAVAHAPDGDPTWGAGDRGWMLKRYLQDCG